MSILLGIDLGTTYSAAARVTDDGNLHILDNGSGGVLTPSVIHLDGDGRVTVGEEAKRMLGIDAENTIIGIKRSMGKDETIYLADREFRPEGLSALILQEITRNAARELAVRPQELRAVITVPAYFGTAEREATAAAARIAGIDCLDLVAEPVAAALSYGVNTGDTGVTLVYDLGGGTFDATVVELTSRGPRVVAVDGSTELGGLNFDERIATLLLERYLDLTGDDEAQDDEEFMSDLMAQAEVAKRKLTTAHSSAITVTRGKNPAKVSLSRDEFESATGDLVAETLRVCDRVLAASGLRNQLGRVVLVGGSTRMPVIAQELGKRYALNIRVSDPDLAVAKGAAIHARALRHGIGSDNVNGQRAHGARADRGEKAGAASRLLAASTPLRTVLPRALGFKVHDSADRDGSRVFVDHVVGANTPLPITDAVATYATIFDDQDTVRVEIYEQAGAVPAPDLFANRRVLDGEISGIPPGLPGGSPIKVSLQVGTDGRVHCVATEPTTGTELVIESYIDGVSDSAQADDQTRAISSLVWSGA